MLALVLCMSMSIYADATAEVYMIGGIIEMVDYVHDCFSVTMQNGHVYEFTEIEDLFILDYVWCIMDDMGTPDDFEDDVCIELWYAGMNEFFDR